MPAERIHPDDPRIQAALTELQTLIMEHYPEAHFDVMRGEDPDGIYLKTTVDVDDADEVVDCYIDRLVELQVDEELPVYVITLQPLEHAANIRQAQRTLFPVESGSPLTG